jgi:hypothetical protein
MQGSGERRALQRGALFASIIVTFTPGLLACLVQANGKTK